MTPYRSGIIEIIEQFYNVNYIDADAGFTLIKNDDGEFEMTGSFHNVENKVYSKAHSAIFSSVSGNIIFNQITMAALAEAQFIDASEGIEAIGKLIITDFKVQCRAMITENSDKSFKMIGGARTDKRGRRFFDGEVNLGTGAFIMEGKGFNVPRDLHDYKAMNKGQY